jgi:hypothetical protein
MLSIYAKRWWVEPNAGWPCSGFVSRIGKRKVLKRAFVAGVGNLAKVLEKLAK